MNAPEPQSLDGILLVDKPEGPTSMRAVERVRRAAAGIRCGHAGTLDPLATGLLVIALGRFTKMIATLMGGDKRYETVIDLSAFTTTDDREGEATPVQCASPPTSARLDEALAQFRGSILQAPPAFSAVKIAGKRSYDLARHALRDQRENGAESAAATPAPLPRPAFVHTIEVREYRYPLVALDIQCAKGFYVRSLARDLGRALSTGGHCRLIRRTFSAPFSVNNAIKLDELPPQLTRAHLTRLPGAT